MLAREPSLPDIDPDEAADEEAMADYRNGRVISHEAVMAWIKSWGTPEEVPRPEIGE